MYRDNCFRMTSVQDIDAQIKALQLKKTNMLRAETQKSMQMGGAESHDLSLIKDPRIRKMVQDGGYMIDGGKVPDRILDMDELTLKHKIAKYERKIARILDAKK